MRKVLRSFLFVSILSLVVISCEKESEPFPPVKSQEKPSISLPDGNNLITAALDISTAVITVEILEIRRDATSPADLNRVQTVKIAKSNSVLSDLSGAAVTELPRDFYQNHPDNPFDGQFWTITFQPGEFVKHLKINLKTIDLVTLGRVGLGFQLASADNGAVLSASQYQVAVELGSKNQWDGIYRLDAYTEHPTNPVLTGICGPYEMPLITTAANKVTWQFTHPWANGSNSTTPAGYNPVFTINTTTNSVAVTDNSGIGFENDPTYTNPRYDPVAKKFYVKWRYNAAGGYRMFTDTLTFIRPR